MGADTLYRIAPKRNSTTSAPKSVENGMKRKILSAPTIPKRKKLLSCASASRVLEKQHIKRGTPNESNSESNESKILPTQQRNNTHLHESVYKSDKEDGEISSGESSTSQLEAKSHSGEADPSDESNDTAARKMKVDGSSDQYTRDWYRNVCDQLTKKTNTQKKQIKSFKHEIQDLKHENQDLQSELANETNLRQSMQQQLKDLQRKIDTSV